MPLCTFIGLAALGNYSKVTYSCIWLLFTKLYF